jgi:murein DD-endopeptidase MepM/ murein hydrolase activator NlpD
MDNSNNNKERPVKKYTVTLKDDSAGRRLRTFRFTGTWIWTAGISAVVLAFLAIFCLIAFTPLRTLIPGYPDARTRKAVIENSIKIDSLSMKLRQWEFYASSLKRVLRGEESFIPDSLFAEAGRIGRDSSANISQGADSTLRAYVKGEEQFEVPHSTRSLPIEGIHFYTPVKGVISTGFSTKRHPFSDISSTEGSMVKAVLDGTVVQAFWSEDNLWTIIIQHPDNIISVSGGLLKMLSPVGEKVKGGAAIGVLGEAPGEGSRLRFSLWYRGEAVDPARYISF